MNDFERLCAAGWNARGQARISWEKLVKRAPGAAGVERAGLLAVLREMREPSRAALREVDERYYQEYGAEERIRRDWIALLDSLIAQGEASEKDAPASRQERR